MTAEQAAARYRLCRSEGRCYRCWAPAPMRPLRRDGKPPASPWYVYCHDCRPIRTAMAFVAMRKRRAGRGQDRSYSRERTPDVEAKLRAVGL